MHGTTPYGGERGVIDAVWPEAGGPEGFQPTFQAAEPEPITERDD